MELFNSVSLQCRDQTVDTTALVRSCVQSAVGMLRDQVEKGHRSAQRVEILLTLLCDQDEMKGDTNTISLPPICSCWIRFYRISYPTHKGEFLQTVKAHLHSMLLSLENNPLSAMKSNWVIKEASNFDALQEGGTFRYCPLMFP